MKLDEVMLIESVKKPGAKAWGQIATAVFTSKGDVDGPFDLSYDVPTGLVTIARNGQSVTVHISRTRELRPSAPVAAAPTASAPVSTAQVVAAVKPQKKAV